MFYKTLGKAVAIAALAIGCAAGMASAQTVAELKDRGAVKIGVLVGAPPFGSIDATGNPVGYDADVAVLVGEALGVEAELVPLTPPARIPALESGKVDFLIATLAATPERAKAVTFTDPYSAFQVGIYAPQAAKIADWADLDGLRVGVNRGSSVEATLIEHGLDIVRFDDDATTMQALFSGQVDAVAEPDAQANAVLRIRGDAADMEQKFVFSIQPNSMAVRMDSLELRDWLNGVIADLIESGQLNAISEKWIGSPLPDLKAK
jgi:polar amino acid transport system substrate-binding protein